MKTKNIKKWLWLTAMLVVAMNAGAQTKPTGKTAYNQAQNDNFDIVHNENGNTTEKIQMERDGKLCRAVLVNNKMTELYIDGEKIPAADWEKHQDAIEAINAQLVANRIQAKKNAEQAGLNEIQAKKNQEQAVKNEEQEKKNAEQAVKNQEQDKRNEEQAARNREQEQRNAEQAEKNKAQADKNEEQARLNKEQEKRNEEQVARNHEQDARNEEQAKLNKEQEQKNAEQAVKNREQEKLNAVQAEKNRIQAEANERFIKLITADLVADKIIPDGKSLHNLKLNGEEMIVNGVKQPDDVYKRYAAKYKDFLKDFDGTFSFSN